MKEKLKLHPTEYCPKDLTNQTKKMMEHKIKWTILKLSLCLQTVVKVRLALYIRLVIGFVSVWAVCRSFDSRIDP